MDSFTLYIALLISGCLLAVVSVAALPITSQRHAYVFLLAFVSSVACLLLALIVAVTS